MGITHELLKTEISKLPTKFLKEINATDDGKKFSLLMLKKLSGYKNSRLKDFYTEGGGDHQIDGVYFTEEGDRLDIHIITCKFPTNGSKIPDQDVTDFLNIGVKYLILGEEKAHDLNSKLKSLREEIVERMKEYNNNVAISLEYICSSDEVLSNNGKGMVNIFLAEMQIHGYDIDCAEYNLKRLSSIFSNRTVVNQLMPIKLSGKSYYQLVGREGFVCRLPVSELVKIYYGFDDGEKKYLPYGDYLFTDNVRRDIGLAKDKNINIEIYKTATNPTIANDFEHYNNGLTIIYKDKLGNLGQDSPILYIKGLRVVNGCQTVSTLMKAKDENKLCDDIYLTCRFIKETEDKEFIRSVTKYTNSQNPITPRDLHSNDSVQFDIQGVLEKLGVFYEKLLNEYRDIEDNKRLDALFAAQAYLCCELAKPKSAKQEKRKLFTEYYNNIFNAGNADLAYKLLIASRTLEYSLDRQSETKRKKNNIRKTGKVPRYRVSDLVVAHGSYHIAAILYQKYFHGMSIERLKESAKNFNYHSKFSKAYSTAVETIAKYISDAKLDREKIAQFFKENDISIFNL